LSASLDSSTSATNIPSECVDASGYTSSTGYIELSVTTVAVSSLLSGMTAAAVVSTSSVAAAVLLQLADEWK